MRLHGLPRSACHNATGSYEKTAAVQSGRPVYQGEETCMWYVAHASAWFVGKSADVGEAKGYLMAEDPATKPESITGVWRCWMDDRGDWLDAKTVAVECTGR